jgi:hypothetical protein
MTVAQDRALMAMLLNHGLPSTDDLVGELTVYNLRARSTSIGPTRAHHVTAMSLHNNHCGGIPTQRTVGLGRVGRDGVGRRLHVGNGRERRHASSSCAAGTPVPWF